MSNYLLGEEMLHFGLESAEGYLFLGYRPGTCLTDWTGEIPDTANLGLWRLKRRHGLENEQCYGLENCSLFYYARLKGNYRQRVLDRS